MSGTIELLRKKNSDSDEEFVDLFGDKMRG